MTGKHTLITQGVFLATLFSMPAYESRSCGEGNEDVRDKNLELIHKFLTKKDQESEEDIKKLLGTFKTLMPYLKAISKYTGEEPFHIRNVEIYCLGFDRQEKDFFGPISHCSHCLVLAEFGELGIPLEKLKELEKKVPGYFMPFHTYHNFLDGFVNLDLRKEKHLNGVTNCMVKQGLVQKIKEGGNKLLVETLKLATQSGKLTFLDTGIEVEFNPAYFELPLEKNAKVAIHQNRVFKILSDWEYDTLAKRNEQVLEAFENFE